MSLPRSYAFRVDFPRRPVLETKELADLVTTAPSQDALHIAPPLKYRPRPTKTVPGTELRGTLPPEERARFVLRVPKDWNGRLVVAAASGVTDETTYDLWFSDFAVSRGYAFAATDKGVTRALLDGDTMVMPMTAESSVRRWASRLESLIALSRERLTALRGAAPSKVYAVGLSNGGFVARRAAELGLVDGAVEVSGVMWRATKGGLLRELPALLRATSRDPWDLEAVARAGFPAVDDKWKPLIDLYKLVYWESSLGLFIADIDPAYSGPLDRYNLDARPDAVAAIKEFENTGDLKCPLYSIAGTNDWLITSQGHAVAYADLVKSAGKSDLHSLELVEGAAHIDTNAETWPFVAPLMPRAHAAFLKMVARVEALEVSGRP